MKNLPILSYRKMTPEELTKARLAMMVGFAFLCRRIASPTPKPKN
jgi:hypothetical protein